MLASELGGLVIIWVGDALGLTFYAPFILWIMLAANMAWKKATGRKFSLLWGLLNGTAFLLSLTPFIPENTLSQQARGIVSNAIVALLFLVGSMLNKPLIQQLAEQRRASAFATVNSRLRQFFRLYGLSWCLFFILRVLFEAQRIYLPDLLPAARNHEDALLKGSLIFMILLSFKGESLYRLYSRLCPQEASKTVH